MSNNQQQLIRKYFKLLFDEFITNRSNIEFDIVFKDYLGQGTLGLTGWEWSGCEGESVASGNHTFKVEFLSNYENGDRWRGTVAHEFTHLYLFSTIGEHEHDDNFYSRMERFENWLDNKQGLTPRKDKSGDRLQHPNFEQEERERERKRREEGEKKCQELNYFNRFLNKNKDLAELEKHYQTVKNSSFYSEDEEWRKKLDHYYQDYKDHIIKEQKAEEDLQKRIEAEEDRRKKYEELHDKRIRDDKRMALITGSTILIVITVFLLFYFLWDVKRKPSKRNN